MGAGNQSIRGLPAAATTHKIYNVEAPASANTEFSQALTSGAKQLMIRCREGAKIQFSFVSGESSSKFITIPKNASYKVTGVDLQSYTLYMQANQASVTIEIEEWS
jgi:hypothetical protein